MCLRMGARRPGEIFQRENPLFLLDVPQKVI